MALKQTSPLGVGAKIGSSPTPSVTNMNRATGSFTAVGKSLAASGSIQAIAVADLIDAETFTLDDGTNAATVFEFDDDASATGEPVDISAITTAAEVAQAMVDAINGVGAGLAITASRTGSIVNLVNDALGADGNVAIADTVLNAGFTHTGMAGGTDGVLDGETFTLDDGSGADPVIFEFDTDDSVTGDNTPVDISAAVTDDDIADAMEAAINASGLLMTALAVAEVVGLTLDSGAQTAVAVSDTVTDAGFLNVDFTVPNGATSRSYKLVAVDGVGNEDAVGTAGTSAAHGAAALSATEFERLTWTDVAGAASYKVYRTVAGGTPATVGLIGTVLQGVQTFDDTGLVGDASTPSASDGTGVGQSLDVKAWERFTVFMLGIVGTWHLEISPDNVNWFTTGSPVTNAGVVECTVSCNYARVVVTAYSSGTIVPYVVGLYSNVGG